MNRILRALIFDFDGLILDTETPLKVSWESIYRQHGLVVPAEEWAGLLGAYADPPQAYDLLERHLGRPIDRDALRLERLRHEMDLLAGEDVLPGVRQLVSEACDRGTRLAVASSSDRAWVNDHLVRLGLRPFFEAVVCAEDVEHTKPAPDLYVAALESLGVSAGDAIALEDSVHGAQAAKRAGLVCVVIPNRVTRHLTNPHADLILQSLSGTTLDSLAAILE